MKQMFKLSYELVLENGEVFPSYGETMQEYVSLRGLPRAIDRICSREGRIVGIDTYKMELAPADASW